MQSLIRICIAAISISSSPLDADETWTCIFEPRDSAAQNPKPENVYISSDQMWPTWLTRHVKIVQKNSEHMFAFELYKSIENAWVARTIILELGSGQMTEVAEVNGDDKEMFFSNTIALKVSKYTLGHRVYY